MIIERETNHAALHAAGATMVRRLSNEEFEVFPDINEVDLPSLELAEAKSRKIAELKRAADAEAAPLIDEYPEVEIKTWESQEREARAWTADNNASVPTLTDICQARGKTLAYLAPKIIEKSDQYRALAASVSGKRQALAEAVESATTVAEVKAVKW